MPQLSSRKNTRKIYVRVKKNNCPYYTVIRVKKYNTYYKIPNFERFAEHQYRFRQNSNYFRKINMKEKTKNTFF